MKIAVVSVVIQNVVFACPGNTDESYQLGARPIASFYASLLGMHIIRDDWYVIANDEDPSIPDLAFGDGPIDYQAPRWPDPEYPQQLHLDIPVADLDEAERLALRLGAVPLQDVGSYRSYADPIGHPFCLYIDSTVGDSGGRAVGGKIGRVVVDCFSPRALASFYAQLLDMPRTELDTPERVVIARDDGRGPALAFQHAQFPAPRWPDPAFPQQVHLDLVAEDRQATFDLATRLGAMRLPDLGGSMRVYADPAGHPFCV